MENKLCRRLRQLLCAHSKCSKELVGTELWVGSEDSYCDVSANSSWRVLKSGEISGVKGNQFESTSSVYGNGLHGHQEMVAASKYLGNHLMSGINPACGSAGAEMACLAIAVVLRC